MANQKWFDLFGKREVETLTARCFDNNPLFLDLKYENVIKMRRKGMFRYEAKWAVEEDSGVVINETWDRNVSGQNP